jgi:hypothetical protein
MAFERSIGMRVLPASLVDVPITVARLQERIEDDD